MDGTAVAIGETIHAGFAAVRPSLRRCWAALASGLLLSITGALIGEHGPVLAILLEMAAATVVYGALYRDAFGRAPGWRGLRWGMDEMRVLASHLLIGLLMALISAVLFIVVGAVALGVARANNPDFDGASTESWREALSGPGALVVGAVPVLCVVLLVWVALRRALSPAATVDEGRVRVLSAFDLTRGLAPKLFVSLVALILPLVAAALVAGVLQSLAGGPVVGIDILVSAAVYFYFAPAWVGALVHVYRRRRPLVETL